MTAICFSSLGCLLAVLLLSSNLGCVRSGDTAAAQRELERPDNPELPFVPNTMSVKPKSDGKDEKAKGSVGVGAGGKTSAGNGDLPGTSANGQGTGSTSGGDYAGPEVAAAKHSPVSRPANSQRKSAQSPGAGERRNNTGGRPGVSEGVQSNKNTGGTGRSSVSQSVQGNQKAVLSGSRQSTGGSSQNRQPVSRLQPPPLAQEASEQETISPEAKSNGRPSTAATRDATKNAKKINQQPSELSGQITGKSPLSGGRSVVQSSKTDGKLPKRKVEPVKPIAAVQYPVPPTPSKKLLPKPAHLTDSEKPKSDGKDGKAKESVGVDAGGKTSAGNGDLPGTSANGQGTDSEKPKSDGKDGKAKGSVGVGAGGKTSAGNGDLPGKAIGSHVV